MGDTSMRKLRWVTAISELKSPSIFVYKSYCSNLSRADSKACIISRGGDPGFLYYEPTIKGLALILINLTQSVQSNLSLRTPLSYERLSNTDSSLRPGKMTMHALENNLYNTDPL